MNNELNSIGYKKKPSDTTVVVAMSGGVDSSTVAGMMKKGGYKVIGITLKLYDDAKQSKEKNYLNTAAALIQESIYEMIIFVEKLKGKKETVISLAGIGDLYVSADGGRNSKMGEYLGQGMTFNEAKKKKMSNVTVEGADLALEIGAKIKKDFNSKTLPLMINMIDTICEEKPLKVDWKNFK